jgi:hypothetical protein
MCEQGSFLAKIAVPTFELGFYAIVPDVCPHSVMAPKCIRIPAIEHTLVVGSLMLCEMSSCFKILKSSVAANLLAVERGRFQVATDHSMDFYTLKVLSTIRCGTKWICYKPDVNTFFALKLCALAALSCLPNNIFTNRANAVVQHFVSDPLICLELNKKCVKIACRWQSRDTLLDEFIVGDEIISMYLFNHLS